MKGRQNPPICLCTNSEISSSCVSNTYGPKKNSSISKSYDRNRFRSPKSALNFFFFFLHQQRDLVEFTTSCVSNIYDLRKNSSISKSYDRNKLRSPGTFKVWYGERVWRCRRKFVRPVLGCMKETFLGSYR